MPRLSYIPNATLGRPKYERLTQCQAATVSPSATDIAWAAGFFEGEGHFGLNHRKLGRAASNVARVTQKQLQPLFRLQRIFGGSVKQARSDGYGEWRTYGARARGIMLTVFTFMSDNKKRDIVNSLGVTCGAN